jgi:tetratricopeptide (TPR) repeat protein
LPFLAEAQYEGVTLLLNEAEKLQESDPGLAYIKSREGLRQAEEMAWKQGISDANMLIGRIFYQQAAFAQSLKHFLQAFNLYRSLEDPAKIAEVLNELALVYYYTHNFPLAYQACKEALHLSDQHHDASIRAESLGCLGFLNEKEGKYEEALANQEAAYKIYMETGNQKGMVRILINIGSIYEDLANYSAARQYFEEGLDLAISIDDHTTVQR